MTFKPRLLTAFAVAIVALIAHPQLSHAAFVSTDSVGTFQADTTGDVLANFSGIPLPNGSGGATYGGYNPLSGYASLQGASLSTSNIGGVVNVNSGGFYGANDIQTPYAVNSTYTSGPDSITIALPTAETAFALDFDSLFNSTVVTVTLSNGANKLYSTNVTTSSTLGQTSFLGLTSSTPFTSVTLSDGPQQSLVVADFTQGSAVTTLATPLPGSGGMMLVALLMFLGTIFWSKRNGNTAARSRI